jgi:hypothetical protein
LGLNRRRSERQAAKVRAQFFQKQLRQYAGLVPVGGAVLLLILGRRYADRLPLNAGTVVLGAVCLLLVSATFSWLTGAARAARSTWATA